MTCTCLRGKAEEEEEEDEGEDEGEADGKFKGLPCKTARRNGVQEQGRIHVLQLSLAVKVTTIATHSGKAVL